MAINFPSNPNVNDTHVVGSTIWTWDGSSWNGVSHDPIEIATLTYPSVDGTAGQLLITDGAGNLSFGNLSSATLSTVSIDALSDVDITSVAPTDGQVLVWDNANSTFIPGSNAGYSDSSVDTHLNTSAATSNQVLSWDGADYAWVAQSSGGGTLGASISGVEESFSVIENATGTVTHDCDNGHIFYHKTPSADWTVNLTNLGLTNHYATAVTIIIQQGATAYIPSALQIGGTSTGIRWASDTTPTGNADSTDQVTFSIMTDGTTTFALGQLSTYGQGTGTLSAPVPQGTAIAWGGDRMIVAGSEQGTTLAMDYIEIPTPSNASNFGDLSQNQGSMAGFSNETRGVFAGGRDGASYNLTTVQYVTPSTLGNATASGSMGGAKNLTGCSDGTTGLTAGGISAAGGPRTSQISYITINTLGTAQTFGQLSTSKYSTAGFADATYGVWSGGYTTASIGDIEYVTIATPSNASAFGTLTNTTDWFGATGVSDATYGLTAGGYGHFNSIEYVTIASPANSQDFGDLSARSATSPFGSHHMAGGMNGTYGVFSGGGTGGTSTNIIDYVVISTPGNATDFGDRLASQQMIAGVSGSPS